MDIATSLLIAEFVSWAITGNRPSTAGFRDRDTDDSTGPFSAEQLAVNAAGSAAWETRQLLRRAENRMRERRPAEAAHALTLLLKYLPAGNQRTEIVKLISHLKADASDER